MRSIHFTNRASIKGQMRSIDKIYSRMKKWNHNFHEKYIQSENEVERKTDSSALEMDYIMECHCSSDTLPIFYRCTKFIR